MKNKIVITTLVSALMIFASCNAPSGESQNNTAATADAAPAAGGQESVQDDVSQKDIVKIAVGSADHTTLVTALKAAELVNDLANAGPFTVFAPTNEAFAKLPAGTVDDLLKPEKKEALQNILQYHVTVAVFKPESFTDGQVLGMVNGDNATITVKEGKVQINGANIIASVPASNGIVHVIDAVLLPPTKN